VGNHFPAMPNMALAALQYTIVIGGITGPLNSMPAGQLDLVNFAFMTGIDGTGTMQFDYSTFDQDAHETQLKAMLTQIATIMGGNLAVSTATVQAGLSVTRTWFFCSPIQVGTSGTYPQASTTDQMAYP
jgi:hypothetical protein